MPRRNRTDLIMAPSPINWTSWQGEMLATLMFIVRDGHVLLIEKKRGLGAGKINGPGGKIEPGETPLQAVIRETQEELCITPHAPLKLGELWFAMSDHPHILCHVFRSENFSGTPTETAEAVPLWSALDAIPYQRMWEDDRHWLPLLLEKTPFLGRFVFAGERMVWSQIRAGSFAANPESRTCHSARASV
jgi:8-oxo-dGTP diphosphatase